MNLKKVVFVFALLLISDFTFTGCTHNGKRAVVSVAPTARELEIASRGQISPFDPIMRQVAHEEGMDWRLLAAIAYQESRFDPDARSRRGAQGLMQVMNSVAREFGVPIDRISDPRTNIATAVKLIKKSRVRCVSAMPLPRRTESVSYWLAIMPAWGISSMPVVWLSNTGRTTIRGSS